MKTKTKGKVRNSLIIIAILLVTLFFSRGFIYEATTSYRESGGRKNYKVKDKNFASYIEENISGGQSTDIESVIDLSLKITGKTLSYSADVKENDPNKLVLLRTANRTGYASFAAATGNYLIEKYKLAQVWEAKPVKGKFYLFGMDMRAKTKSETFKDYDFVIFRNKATKREIAVDPVVYDSWGISRVSKY